MASTSASSIGPYHPSQVEEVLPDLPLEISDPEEERPGENDLIPTQSTSDSGALSLPPVVLGCAVFGYGIYADKSDVVSDQPLRTLRYALRSGINAFDTSPWYHPSEIVMGRVLERLRDEFPRERYTLLTKVGKYGPKVTQHIYDGPSVRASVERSLRRLRTDYLDVVYLHDVEYVASNPIPFPPGNHSTALTALTDPKAPDPHYLRGPHMPLGPGDHQILEGLSELRLLQKEGKVHQIGIAGYPLPVLLRIACLAQHTPNIGAIDYIQTYAHYTPLNDNLAAYIPYFRSAGVKQIMNAAPLAMGILTTGGGPSWHPVNSPPGEIHHACRDVSRLCQDRGTSLEDVAVSFGFRELYQDKEGKERIPVVIGCKNIEEIKRTVKGWKGVNAERGATAEEREKMKRVEEEVQDLFVQKGVKGFSWSSVNDSAL